MSERLFRTFKEQVVYGRVFQTIDELQAAVREWVGRCSARHRTGAAIEPIASDRPLGHMVHIQMIRPAVHTRQRNARERLFAAVTE